MAKSRSTQSSKSAISMWSITAPASAKCRADELTASATPGDRGPGLDSTPTRQPSMSLLHEGVVPGAPGVIASSSRAQSREGARHRADVVETPRERYDSGCRDEGGGRLQPNRAQRADGILIDPAVSVPIAAGVRPADKAAALPPDEPPGMCAVFHGLVVGGVEEPRANSWVRAFPMSTHPASRSALHTGASSNGTLPANRALPASVAIPAVSTRSLTAIGIPSSGRSSSRAQRSPPGWLGG